VQVTKLVNIGKGLEKLLAEINITTAEEFLLKSPVDLYCDLEKKHPGLHLAVLASFTGAHTGTPWYFIYHEHKNDHRGSK